MAQDAPRTRRRMYLTLGIIMLALIACVLWYWHPWHRSTPLIIHIRERINPRDGAVMVWVPAGNFSMGGDAAFARNRYQIRNTINRLNIPELISALQNYLYDKKYSDASHVHDVFLDGYWIYKYEVTVKQYRAFCRATGREMPPEPDWGQYSIPDWRKKGLLPHRKCLLA